MRNFTLNLMTRIGTRLATEPLIIIGIEWLSGTRYYSDKTRTVGTYNCEGKILEIGSFTSKLDAKASGQLESFSFTLSDTDGSLKNILDLEITLYRTVNIYLHYEGLDSADLGLVFKGKIVSPIEWDEGERKVNFNLNSSVDSKDVLLEIKETSVDFPDPNDIGIVLPLCFGTVLRVPAAKLGNKRTGKLLTSITSWTTWYTEPLDPDSAKITWQEGSFKVEGFEDYPLNSLVILEVDGTIFRGKFTDSQTFVVDGNAGFNMSYPTTSFRNRPTSDTDFDNTSCAFITNLDTDLKGKCLKIFYTTSYRYYTVTKDGTEYDQLVLSERNIPDDVTVKTRYRRETFVARVSDQDYASGKIYFNRPFTDYFGRSMLMGEDVDGSYVFMAVGKAEYDWSQLPEISEPLSWTILPGEIVRIYGYEGLHIPNSVPSTEILEVCARRKGGIVPIPSSYYTKYLSIAVNINGITENVTMIKLKKLLTLRGEDWDSNDLFVSLRSSINSNTASDVATWILNNRTNVTPDAATFATTALALTNYPSHFAILSQKDAIEAIKDIAWQARCGVYVESNVMFMQYLSKAPTAFSYSVTTAIVELKTMNIKKTESDDICTVFKGYWYKSYDETVKHKITKENNKAYYPNKLFEADFTIYNIESLVDKSLDFYKNRYSNDWIFLRVKTLMYSSAIQIYDNVNITVPQINNGLPVIGLVLDFVFDKAGYSTELGIWIPLTNGDGTAYLDDSLDTMPADPGLGLCETNYTIPNGVKVTKYGPKFKGKKNQAPSDSDRKPDAPDRDDKYIKLSFEVVHIYDDYLLCLIDPAFLDTETEKLYNDDGYVVVQKTAPPLEWKDQYIGEDYYAFENNESRKHSYIFNSEDYYTREIISTHYTEGMIIEAEYIEGELMYTKDYGQLVWREIGNDFVFLEEVDPFSP